MREIRTELEIEASAEDVWKVLTDFAQYSAWNPFMTEVYGAARRDEVLDIRLVPPGGKPTTFRPRVEVSAAPKLLRWRGRVLIPGIFDGDHTFEITPIGAGRVLFAQSEEFTGIAVPFFGSVFGPTKNGFIAMNKALKTRAETQS